MVCRNSHSVFFYVRHFWKGVYFFLRTGSGYISREFWEIWQRAEVLLLGLSWRNRDYFPPANLCQPVCVLQALLSRRGEVKAKDCFMLRRSLSFGQECLVLGQRLSRSLGEDNHMPILPIMTCPKLVLELIILLIWWCWKTMFTSFNLTSFNPRGLRARSLFIYLF